MWSACFGPRDFHPAWPGHGRRSSIGRFWVLHCRSGRCRGPSRRRYSTNCSSSPRDNGRYTLRSNMLRDRQPSRRLRMNTPPPERLEGTVDPKLLEILVCPLTKGPLEFDATKQELISRSAKLAYPIRDGIPIMLPEEARTIE